MSRGARSLSQNCWYKSAIAFLNFEGNHSTWMKWGSNAKLKRLIAIPFLMQSLMGETPKTALPSQDRLGALSVGELNSPRVAPLHRFEV